MRQTKLDFFDIYCIVTATTCHIYSCLVFSYSKAGTASFYVLCLCEFDVVCKESKALLSEGV